MKFKKLAIFLPLIFTTSCGGDFSKFEERVGFDQEYSLSSDVITGIYVAHVPVTIETQECIYHQEEIEVTRTFKGSLSKGERIIIHGLTAQENYTIGSEHLLFLSIVDSPVENDPCIEKLYQNTRANLLWCCALTEDAQGVVLYDMVNSEVKSENYILSSEEIFIGLNSLENL